MINPMLTAPLPLSSMSGVPAKPGCGGAVDGDRVGDVGSG